MIISAVSPTTPATGKRPVDVVDHYLRNADKRLQCFYRSYHNCRNLDLHSLRIPPSYIAPSPILKVTISSVSVGNWSESEQPPALVPAVQRATHPFNEDSADVVIRTSDNVEFRVHKTILALGSGTFKDLLSIPEPLNEAREAIPVAEDSETMDAFLRICYPVINPKLTSVDHIRRVLAAGVKYDSPAVIDQMKVSLMAPQCLDVDPLGVYSVACVFHLEEEAKSAAEAAVIMGNTWSEDTLPVLDDISAGAYFRLLQLYRSRVACSEPRAGPGKKKRKGASVNSTPSYYYIVRFDGIEPFCRLPPSTASSIPVGATGDGQLGLEPFSHAMGDLIFRSHDEFEFHVHHNILAFASPTLLSRLILEEPKSTSDGREIPVYRAQECGVILDILLRLCYPVAHPQVFTPDVFLAVLSAAHKYEMAKAEQILRGLWQKISEANPLRFYFAAVEQGWKDEALICADQLARLPSYSVSGCDRYVPEMDCVRSVPYRHLLSYVEKKRWNTETKLGWYEGPYGTVPYLLW
ncbi:hypothetical protein BD309DRAFT_863038 [Dichomitus squalens]|uniref:Uncharacterized protein n=1 Tax=Dichomitus squalens TaxID=114155 RepID=A0A4V2K4E0_9APHY|nr:hypothetical protein BD309DRAFT_863038 [Dichomitus squalens]TBU53698.1 hypothetical protein BD310DRAFT_980924 [Dichomitus squalens]